MSQWECVQVQRRKTIMFILSLALLELFFFILGKRQISHFKATLRYKGLKAVYLSKTVQKQYNKYKSSSDILVLSAFLLYICRCFYILFHIPSVYHLVEFNISLNQDVLDNRCSFDKSLNFSFSSKYL